MDRRSGRQFFSIGCGLLAIGIGQVLAQSPEAVTAPPAAATPAQAPNQAPSAAPSSSTSTSGNFLGGDMPFFDPGSETISWDGRVWNINNNRVFQARFEKYLNAPEDDSEADREYNEILRRILDLLAPRRISPTSLDEAFKLLPQASAYEIDAQLGDALANQVHSAWQAMQSRERLQAANRALEEERKRLEWNSQVAAQPNAFSAAPRGEEAQKEWRQQQQQARDAKMQPLVTRLAEVNGLLKANDLKQEVSQLQAKIEFQSLLVQLFMQRRFQHVLIGTRFYRAIFTEGEGQLQVGEDAKSFFARSTGMPPTVSTVDALAGEMIRDVAEGVRAFNFLLDKDEMESATKRLAETFIVGEYLPEIRTLPRERKRKALTFVQQSNQLLSALEVRDYTLAEKLVGEMALTAKDFDASKPLAAIETAKTVSAMHLAKAKNAAVSGDRETLEAELKSATELWPRNPALAEVAELIFSQADVQQRALVDFDQLLSQKNYRQIYDDRARFIAATAMDAAREQQLREVLEQMMMIEGAIMRAQEVEKRGDPFGAWESAERAYLQFPEDSKLNQLRADLTTKAADFVRQLRQAGDLEQREQIGSSLAWYLAAQQSYPASEFAREGIDRTVSVLLPDAR